MSFEGLELDLIVDLVKSMAVVIVVAYLFTRTRLYRQVLDHQLGRQGRLLLVLIFGAFSVWGTISGVEVNGAIANTRDLGPALGGLIGGPVVGIGAGLIGGLQRLAMGGWTAVPSALGAVCAGVAGGAVFLLCGRRVAPVWAAMLLAVLTESVLMGLNLLMARPFGDAVALVRQVIVPMILVNAAGMGLFVFIVRNEQRERQTAAQKERMEGELNVARDIQRSIVPTIFPPFPEREEFDLHATLEPAREVGGDLYDFFLFDDERLCLAIGDVSGKGVPASLFMAVTITLLRAAGARSADPAKVLAQVNAPLCRGNDAAMFVTLFYSVYDIRTGELTYSTGGHLPPCVVRAAGGVETAARTTGPGLGISPSAAFGAASLHLQPGDALLLFSDGVTEAMDARQRMFGTERLEAVLLETGTAGGAQGLLTAVREAVDTFAAGAEQYDDLTLLGFRRTV
jgi:sigma-B regulation protein RsbU (phosphoserine phosphatase)